MEICKINIEWIQKPTYQDVKQLYECFNNAFEQIAHRKMGLDFNFSCSSFDYTATSIERFTELAYGENNFKLNALQFMGFLNNGEIVAINYLCGLSVSASSKVLLEDFINKLELGKYFDNMGENNTTNVGNNTINHQQNNTSNGNITVTGNGNTIINNVSGTNNTIGNNNTPVAKKEQKKLD